MTSTRQHDSDSLHFAIDHRIRALFEPVTLPVGSTADRDHISVVKHLGYQIGRPQAEVDITGQLAEPETTGGIAVILQQPRNRHPFTDGLDAVIEDCPTLLMLDEFFYTVSCGTIDLTHVSVLDLLPFTTPDEIDAANTVDCEILLHDRLRTCVEAICHKKPKVVICAGKYAGPKWDDETLKHIKGEVWKLESFGVGRIFGDYTFANIQDAEGNKVRFERVNPFHPSFAINYAAHHFSCFRQLLLLSICEACARANGNGRKENGNGWKELVWMKKLRNTCKEQCTDLKTSQVPEHEPEDRVKVIRQNDERAAVRYCSLLEKISATIHSIASSSETLYVDLVDSSLTTLLNDASLALRYMAKRDDEIEIPGEVASRTLDLAAEKCPYQRRNMKEQLMDEILAGFRELGNCVNNSDPREWKMDLEGAMKVFLEMAKALEILLWDWKADMSIEELNSAIASLDLDTQNQDLP